MNVIGFGISGIQGAKAVERNEVIEPFERTIRSLVTRFRATREIGLLG